jgi:hypothetical protein
MRYFCPDGVLVGLNCAPAAACSSLRHSHWDVLDFRSRHAQDIIRRHLLSGFRSSGPCEPIPTSSSQPKIDFSFPLECDLNQESRLVLIVPKCPAVFMLNPFS